MLEPMLASLADAPLTDPQLVYEPKYDGIRAIAEIDGVRVRLWSRLGKEKTNQFPEIVRALGAWGKTLDAPVVLDGEVVALDVKGQPTGFQQLQGRIHVHDPGSLAAGSRGEPPSATPVAYIAFDVLRRGRTDLRDRTLVDRRTALEQLLDGATTATLRVSEQVR